MDFTHQSIEYYSIVATFLAPSVRPRDLLAAIARILGGEEGIERVIEEFHVADDGEVLDNAIVNQLEQAAGPAATGELIDIFLNEMSARVRRMATSAADGDTAALGEDAHALKSSSGTFGACRLQNLAAAIEGACATGNAAVAMELVIQLEGCSGVTREAFVARISRITSITSP